MSNELDPTDFDAVIGYYNIGGLDRQQERLTEPNMGADMTDKDRALEVQNRASIGWITAGGAKTFLGVTLSVWE
jgi:hypothetical protein